MGARLNRQALAVKIKGQNIHDLSELQLCDLYDFILEIDQQEASTVLDQIAFRLKNLVDLGVGYLHLSRPTGTLSGGEAQRVKLSRQLGNGLVEMLYVLDEPSVGLHPRDVHLVNKLLFKLRDAGNTILVVDHDPDVIQMADHVVDLGPSAGRMGGEVVFSRYFCSTQTFFDIDGTHVAQRGATKEKLSPFSRAFIHQRSESSQP